MSKTCPSCNFLLEESAFNWRVKNVKLASYCKKCSRRYIQEHYAKNSAYYIKKAKKRNFEVKTQQLEYIGKFLQSHPCVDCGETDILVLEFDHKYREDKVGEISVLIKRRFPLPKLISEIKKCEVRCANCHRRKPKEKIIVGN